MGTFLLLAAATLISEDLTCIAAGALIAAGKLNAVSGTLACALGIFFGDLLLYFAGRMLGRPALRSRPLRRMLTTERVDRASAWLAARGARVIFASRFTPGLRLPTYFAAGLLKTRFWTFATYFLLAAFVWTPLLVGGAALLGEGVLRAALGHARLATLIPIGAIALVRFGSLSSLRRLTRWEFWPVWLAYLPLIPWLLWLALKHRSLTVVMQANPGISSGGLVGESKSEILRRLPHVPEFRLIPVTVPPEERLAAIPFDYPVVLKPDVGERGNGVLIARTAAEADRYLRQATRDIIVQRYVGGCEFGVFYYRYPGESQGRLFSITEKHFPQVVGDGHSTLAELIRNDPRAVFLADVYLSRLRRDPATVPAPGERVPLAEIGSHCKGAIFRDGGRLETEALRKSIDDIAKCHPGFYFGRFDVRSPSVHDFLQGRVQVLELNGISAEATHIYDPSVSVWEAYRVLFRQWRIAFEIGAAVCNGLRGNLPAVSPVTIRL